MIGIVGIVEVKGEFCVLSFLLPPSSGSGDWIRLGRCVRQVTWLPEASYNVQFLF